MRGQFIVCSLVSFPWTQLVPWRRSSTSDKVFVLTYTSRLDVFTANWPTVRINQRTNWNSQKSPKLSQLQPKQTSSRQFPARRFMSGNVLLYKMHRWSWSHSFSQRFVCLLIFSFCHNLISSLIVRVSLHPLIFSPLHFFIAWTVQKGQSFQLWGWVRISWSF